MWRPLLVTSHHSIDHVYFHYDTVTCALSSCTFQGHLVLCHVLQCIHHISHGGLVLVTCGSIENDIVYTESQFLAIKEGY